MIDAYHTTLAHVSSAKQRPGVERMNDVQLEEFLAGSELHESQKQEIRDANRVDRGRAYQKVIYWHEKARVEQTARALSSYLAKFGIFISNKAAFAKLEDMIWNALTEYSMSFEDEIHEREDVRRLEKDGANLKDQLEAEIHGRLWNTALIPATTAEKPKD
ncbi:MAG: hypothetical protein ABI398_07855 [Devosia sp.]